MLISNLRLKNWRNFRDVDVALQPRQFIVGPNASPHRMAHFSPMPADTSERGLERLLCTAPCAPGPLRRSRLERRQLPRILRRLGAYLRLRMTDRVFELACEQAA